MFRAKTILSGAVVAAIAVIGAAVLAPGATAIDAAMVIKERKALMKEVVLKGFKATKQMIKDDFIEAADVASSMTKIAEVAAVYAKRFPKGTETGGETTASAEIWKNKADFEKRFVTFTANAKAAAATAANGDDAVKAAFKTLAKDCSGCHKLYRIKKN